MIKKINKEIHRLEQQKELKSSQKSKLELEINEISGKLKELNSLKNQYEKLEEGVKNFFNPTVKWDIYRMSCIVASTDFVRTQNRLLGLNPNTHHERKIL